MSTKPFSFLLACLLVFHCSAMAQQRISFTTLTTKDGLSSNNVNAILKDHTGLMWFATDDGLNKWDGAHFSIYRQMPGNAASLPANEVLFLHEDKKGNLWVGTGGGSVNLYDRQKDSFIRFAAQSGNSSIRNEVIRTIASDHNGTIWVGHYAGIDLLNPQTRTASGFKVAGQGAFSHVTISFFEDSKRNMWIGTYDGLFCYHYPSRTLQKMESAPGPAAGLGTGVVTAITEDPAGNIWAGTNKGLYVLHPGAPYFQSYSTVQNGQALAANASITTLTVGNNNQLWVGTTNGLYVLTIATGGFTLLQSSIRDVHSLSGNGIVSTYFDPQGIYWVGTFRGGLNKYDQNLTLFPLIQGNVFDKQGLNASVVTSFVEKDPQHIFVGTEVGGVSLFEPATRAFQHFDLRSRRPQANGGINVLALALTKRNELLAGTYANGLFILNPATGTYQQLLQGNAPEDLNDNNIFSVMEDHLGNRWVGTNGSGINVLSPQNKVVLRFTPTPKYPNDVLLPINGFIRDIVEDKAGQIWIATHGGGLALYHPASRQFTVYNTTNSNLPTNRVQSVLLDSRGRIWAGTFGGGLCLLHPETRRFTIFSEKEGLQNNNVRKVLEDKTGYIWVSSDKGISCLNPATRKITNYNTHNGVQPNSFVHGSGLYTADGTLYFGGLEGFNYFSPAYLKKNKNVPAVLITELKVANQTITPSEKGPIRENILIAQDIHLDYKQNFALSFVGLNYTAPEQNQYAYKLEGFDKNWNYVGSTTTASYTNLDPGEYTFRVMASNNDGIWNKEGKSVKIFVHPPFWRTPYAYVLYFLAAAGLLLYIRHRGIKKLKRQFAAEQLQNTLQQQRREAERVHELDQQKIKFLTNLSHEFRTPISLITGPADTLLAQAGNEQQAGQLQLIKRNGKRLLNLVNQLLDFRKMEEHELTLQPSEGELVAFVKDVTDSFRDLSEKKKIHFTSHSTFDAFSTRFDHDKLERILFNLLSNAFKFTLKDGTVSLLMSQAADAANPGTAWISFDVADTGIGIPAAQQGKIFDRFFQHTTAGAILNQGTGIGLSITKEFVELQGGTIAVQSEPDKGTTFTVRLPLVPLAAPAAQPVPAEADADVEVTTDEEAFALEVQPVPAETAAVGLPKVAGTQAVSSILLVEDNDDFRFYLKENLQQRYKVYEAANGKEGWQKALALHPQLIVSDISMPYMDGIELCKKLKADKRTSHIPVILLTALAAEQDQLRGLETGASDYITKPFSFEVLSAKVNNLLLLNTTLKSTYTRQIKVLTPEVKVESEDEKLMERIMHYLEENLTNSQLSVEDMSRQVGMSRSSLYGKLLELTGQTPVEFIRSVKLEKAALLLEKSDMTIAQIAYSVGFATPNYFTKSFKAKYGLLPSEYVQQAKNKNESV